VTDDTACGETFEHDQHIFHSKRRGYLACDGTLRSHKVRPSDEPRIRNGAEQ
jgi:hypothetical protein